uniref:Uncharacterized protein LOC109505617 n=1 Tax=Elaeis guineensis var. tenera TaxID=51953 RepID=A0A6J0PGA6_ELAGV|nr:uncharacterized protein LOC109505617 [Elaeis guineensis]
MEISSDKAEHRTNKTTGRDHGQDSGCSNHMTGVKEIFQNLDESVKVSVYLDDNKQVQSEGKDTIVIRTCKKVDTPMNANEKLTLEDDTDLADATSFRKLVGGLMYLTYTRPDIVFAVTKKILRYVRGTSNYGIWYSHITNLNLFGFSDSDWVDSLDDRKSTTGFLFSLDSGAITWTSKKQVTVALSLSETEYVAGAAAACQAIWVQRILEDLQQLQLNATEIFCDNMAAIFMSKIFLIMAVLSTLTSVITSCRRWSLKV